MQSRGIKNGIHSFYCKNCDDWDRIRETEYNTPDNLPVAVVMDIEYLPMKFYGFNLFDTYVSPDQVIENACFLSWCGKYLYDDTMYGDILTPKEAINRDASRITKSAFEFLKNADIAIGHNFRNYDAKYLNTCFLEYAKPLRYRIIDTLEVAKNNFKFASNKLSFINKKLGIREKISNEGLPLWIKCSDGDKESRHYVFIQCGRYHIHRRIVLEF